MKKRISVKKTLGTIGILNIYALGTIIGISHPEYAIAVLGILAGVSTALFGIRFADLRIKQQIGAEIKPEGDSEE